MSHELKKRVVTISKQSRWVFAGKVFFVFTGFASSALLSRILGPSLLGRYQLGLTVVLITAIFTVAGFDKGLVRFLPVIKIKNSSEARALFAISMQISLVISVALATALYFSAPLIAIKYFHSEEMTRVVRVFSVYLPVISALKIVSGGVNGIKRADVDSNISNVLIPLFFLTFLIAIYFSGQELISCILARMAASLLGVITLILFFIVKVSSTGKSIEKSISYRQFFSFSTNVMFIGAIYFLLGHMDIIMLGYFVPEREVGIYAVALKIAVLVIFGLQVMLPIVRPHFSELSELRDFAALEALFKTATRWVLYSGLFVFSLIIILREEVLNVFGPEFVVGGSTLIILGIGNLANAVSGPTGAMLVMTGQQKWEILNIALMAIINFLLNIVLIPRMGSIGAAIATALSISAINAAKFIEVYLIYKIHPYSMKCFKGIFAIICGFVTCYFVRASALHFGFNIISLILLSSIIFGAVTIILIFILGLDAEEKMLLGMLKGRK